MQASHLYYLNGISTQFHGLAADIVDVTLLQQVIGVLVVGAEHAPVEMPGRLYKLNERLQILGCGTFPHHDELTKPQLQQCVV